MEEREKTITAWNIIDENSARFMIKGVKFTTKEPEMISVFHEYKHNNLEIVNQNIIDPFLVLIKEVICSNDDKLYNYVIGWISLMIQHPGIKNETAVMLKGLQRIGKKRICECYK